MNGTRLFRHTGVFLSCFIAFGFLPVAAQVASGGSYTLDQAVVANGGGSSSGAGYTVDGTIGQYLAGDNSAGGTYGVKDGFWLPIPLGTTAAGVDVSGRVVNESGMGIGNVRVTLMGGTLTAPRAVLTSPFGYFTLSDVEVGQTYVVSVTSKHYGFGQSSQIVPVMDNVSGLVFVSTWRN